MYLSRLATAQRLQDAQREVKLAARMTREWRERARGTDAKIPHASPTRVRGATAYELIQPGGLTQARPKLKTEQVVTKQLKQDRRSIHDLAQQNSVLLEILRSR